jgi:ubiquitin-protein ligase
MQVTLHKTYPFRPPEVEFLDVPYHPNVKNTGEFCLELDKVWKPAKSVANVGKMLVEFLSQPNPDHAVDTAIGAQMGSDMAAYEASARKGGRAPVARKDE